MFRIKCSNGKYVEKTTYGTWITYSKKGKVFKSENLVYKNLDLCEKFVNEDTSGKYKSLTFKVEEI
jgi:hypothetical protein